MFAIEMVTKIITMGFIMDNGSYLRESWNQLDFFIVLTSFFDLMMSGKSLGFIKVIRLLRILRQQGHEDDRRSPFRFRWSHAQCTDSDYDRVADVCYSGHPALHGQDVLLFRRNVPSSL
jgi:hypothetical protein